MSAGTHRFKHLSRPKKEKDDTVVLAHLCATTTVSCQQAGLGSKTAAALHCDPVILSMNSVYGMRDVALGENKHIQ